jgi:glycoside/pentoside/hexuronide:cation symporter, GPH family
MHIAQRLPLVNWNIFILASRKKTRISANCKVLLNNLNEVEEQMNDKRVLAGDGRFSPGWKLLFSAGDLSISVPLAILMFFQLFFMTDVAGLRPDYAAWAVIIGRLWDAINDPWFGIISDRIRTRWGRRRTVLLFGAVPLGLGFALMWQVPPFSPLGLTVYYTLTFIIFNSAFTFVRIGYYAMVPELTSDYDERISINGYLMFYSISGSLGAIILITLLRTIYTEPTTLFMIIGIALGLLVILPPMLVFRLTRGMLLDTVSSTMPFRDSIRATLSNRPFWRVIGLYTMSWTTTSVVAASLVYFANYYLRIPDQANYFVLVAQGAALLFVPVWVWAAKKLDKSRAFIIGSLSWLVVLLAISGLGPDQVSLAYLLAALAGAGIACSYVLPWSMIPDVVEFDQLQTGERREGSYYAFASFFQKLAAGLAIWAMGQALAFANYINPTAADPLPVQPVEAVQAIRLFMGPIPAILLVIAVLFAWRYPLTRARYESICDELEEAGKNG